MAGPAATAERLRSAAAGWVSALCLLFILGLANAVVLIPWNWLWGNHPSCVRACQEIGQALSRLQGDRRGCTCYCAAGAQLRIDDSFPVILFIQIPAIVVVAALLFAGFGTLQAKFVAYWKARRHGAE